MTSQPVEILLVEDNEDDAVIIQEVFSDMRLATLINVVRDGEEALAYLQRTGKYKVVRMPDIVLLDIGMPDTDGIQVLQTILEQGIDIPVIIITGRGAGSLVVKAMQIGAADYIRKAEEDFALRHLVVPGSPAYVAAVEEFERQVADAYGEDAVEKLPWRLHLTSVHQDTPQP